MTDSNREILTLLNQSNRWFEAVKVGAVWAKENTESTIVTSLEGDTSAEVGDIICRGPDGEKWVQAVEKFQSKYQLADGTTDETGFKKYLPIPANSQVMAAKVSSPFEVATHRGVLQGKANDYLIKSIEDKNVEFPESVWIVAEDIFATTYKPI